MPIEKDGCKICGYQSLLGVVEEHYTIPTEITEQAEMPPSETLKLCCNCHKELHHWYSIKVNDMIYDSKTQEIRYRTPAEMIKEYQSILNGFIKYKEEQEKIT